MEPDNKSTIVGVDSLRDPLEAYYEYFPRNINFYNMGFVKRLAKRANLADLACAPFLVAFQISGEEAGLCIVGLETRPQSADALSMATELANVLASKFVTLLADSRCADIRISPPTSIEPVSQKERFIAASLKGATEETGCGKRYEFEGQGLGPERVGIMLAFLPNLNHGGLT